MCHYTEHCLGFQSQNHLFLRTSKPVAPEPAEIPRPSYVFIYYCKASNSKKKRAHKTVTLHRRRMDQDCRDQSRRISLLPHSVCCDGCVDERAGTRHTPWPPPRSAACTVDMPTLLTSRDAAAVPHPNPPGTGRDLRPAACITIRGRACMRHTQVVGSNKQTNTTSERVGTVDTGPRWGCTS